ncbi:SAM-dependent DNA methyltransferase [Lacipirellula parvula]|uniref:SAM-dependent DNA methyltransferase n=1 Tax=Lacipirellula parvula TaxID=2650471 RepID=UPI0018E09869|nr:SAM-dependent DNA methyltransferase [Lacipirellula parvula]
MQKAATLRFLPDYRNCYSNPPSRCPDAKKTLPGAASESSGACSYLQAFSPAVRNTFESFEFHPQIDRLAKAGLLYLVTEKFANIDLHPDVVSNAQMGAVFEELIRKFAELSNETAGEHFPPRSHSADGESVVHRRRRRRHECPAPSGRSTTWRRGQRHALGTIFRREAEDDGEG